MVKTINIGGKRFDLKSSAYTLFNYKDKTGRDLMKDIAKINKLQLASTNAEDQELFWLENISDILEVAEQLAYVMFLEATNENISFENWLKKLDGLLENTTWINEVVELAMSTFRR